MQMQVKYGGLQQFTIYWKPAMQGQLLETVENSEHFFFLCMTSPPTIHSYCGFWMYLASLFIAGLRGLKPELQTEDNIPTMIIECISEEPLQLSNTQNTTFCQISHKVKNRFELSQVGTPTLGVLGFYLNPYGTSATTIFFFFFSTQALDVNVLL